MARLTAIAAVLFCLFALSLASTQPENNDVTTSVSLPVSESVNGETVSESSTIVAPLTAFRFNPINNRFHARSRYPCRHRHHLKSVSDPTSMEKMEIPYGNDMLVSSGENSEFENPEIVRGGRRRWVRLHHHHHHRHHHEEDSDSDSDSDEEDGDKITFKSHRFHDHEKFKKRFRHHHEEENKGSFMKRVHDFVNNHF